MSRRLWLIAGAAAVLFAAACGGDSGDTGGAENGATTAPSATAEGPQNTATEVPLPQTKFGIAGLIAANFPNSADEDWADLFSGYRETGTLVGVYQNWNDGPGTEGEIPAAVRVIYTVAGDEPIVPLIGLGVKGPTPDGGLSSTVDYGDPGERQQVIDTLLKLVNEYEVEYLLFGAEINRLLLFDAEAFDGFVALYADAYDAVKAASPETVMFTVFQLELMRGDAFLMGGSESRGPQWDLVDRFEGRLDLLAFTVYAQLDFTDPADIPDDYLSSIADRFGLPLAFTEIGWPSEPLDVAGVEEYGGTPAEQVAFVERFGELTDGLDVRLALWALPHDVGDLETAAFKTIALRANDGTEKPALAAWQALAGVE